MAPEGDKTAPEDPAQPVAFDQGAEEQDSDEDEAQAYASKPMKPKMGGLTKQTADSWAAWTGGKPKADWSELKITIKALHGL